MTAPRRVIVVGASSGIGEALAERYARRGAQVVALARRQDRLDALADRCGPKVLPMVHDVSQADGVAGAFAAARSALGGLDMLIYATGVMHPVTEERWSEADDRDMMQVNLVGAVAWLALGCQHFIEQGAGTLVGISSVAGDRGRRTNPGYTASKAGMTAYLEALRNRSARHGVRVVTIKPGPVATAMTEGRKLPLLIDLEPAVDAILRVLDGTRERAYVPSIWAPIMTAVRLTPSAIFRHLNF